MSASNTLIHSLKGPHEDYEGTETDQREGAVGKQVAVRWPEMSNMWAGDGDQQSRLDSAHRQMRHRPQSATPSYHLHTQLASVWNILLGHSSEHVYCCQRGAMVSPQNRSRAEPLECVFTVISVSSADHSNVAIGKRGECVGLCPD